MAGASPIQHDFSPGFDPSSLVSITQAQLLQMFQQMAPLANIGGIIVMSGGGGISWPGVINNPRFKRYIWLDTAVIGTTVLKVYDQSGADTYANWISSTIAGNSIFDTHINTVANIAVSKLNKGTARYVIRTNAAGTLVEYVAPSSIFNNAEIPVAQLVPHGSSGYLKTSSGVATWVSDDTVTDAVIAAMSSADIVALIGAGALALSQISSGGALTHDTIYFNGTAWAKVTPNLRLTDTTKAISTTGITYTSDLSSVHVEALAHNLGAIPKCIRLVLQCQSPDVGYTAGDEVVASVLRTTAASAVAIGYVADNVNITVLVAVAATELPNKGTGVYTAIDETKWKPKVYAWL